MGPGSFDLFVWSFFNAMQLLIVLAGALAATAGCIAAGWLIAWSISRLWSLARAQSEDVSRKRGE